MPYRQLMTMLLGLGALSACGRADDAQNDNGTDVSVSLDGGNGTIAADGETGRVSIDLGSIAGNFKLPKLKLGGSDVDIDGVKLYPGSKVTGLDIDDPSSKAEGDGRVSIRFDAPAAPATVQRYFLDAFKEKGVTAKADGTGLQGKGEDGKPFTMTLTKAGEGTRGVVLFGPKAG